MKISLSRAKFAKPVIFYHGTRPKFLQSILKHGLVALTKNWDSDPEASATRPSRVSYGGVYLSTNFSTATSSAGIANSRAQGHLPHDQRDFDELIVVCSIVPQSAIPDEDDFVHQVNRALPFNTNIDYDLQHYYLWAMVWSGKHKLTKAQLGQLRATKVNQWSKPVSSKLDYEQKLAEFEKNLVEIFQPGTWTQSTKWPALRAQLYLATMERMIAHTYHDKPKSLSDPSSWGAPQLLKKYDYELPVAWFTTYCTAANIRRMEKVLEAVRNSIEKLPHSNPKVYLHCSANDWGSAPDERYREIGMFVADSVARNVAPTSKLAQTYLPQYRAKLTKFIQDTCAEFEFDDPEQFLALAPKYFSARVRYELLSRYAPRYTRDHDLNAMLPVPPTPSQAEASYMAAVDAFTRVAKAVAKPTPKRYANNLRLDRVGYRGKSRILCVFTIKRGPYRAVVHYGTLLPETVIQLKQRNGE